MPYRRPAALVLSEAERADGLLDEPRPGAPRRIGDEVVAAGCGRRVRDGPPDSARLGASLQ